jgi:hypothetical protein
MMVVRRVGRLIGRAALFLAGSLVLAVVLWLSVSGGWPTG